MRGGYVSSGHSLEVRLGILLRFGKVYNLQ